MAHLRLDSRDFEVDGMDIWMNDSAATAATIQVTRTGMVLTKTGGTSPGATTLLFATYATLATLATAIEAITGGSWLVTKYAPDASTSTSFCFLAATSVLGYANRYPLQIVDDYWLGQLMDYSTDWIQRWCHRVFASATYTSQVYNGDGSATLVLPQYPVTTFTSIYELVDSTWTAIDSDGYRVDLTNGIVYRVFQWAADPWAEETYGEWTEGRQNLRATYTAGYATIPSELQRLALDIAADVYYQAGRNPRARSDKLGSYAQSYFDTELAPGYKERLVLWARVELL